MTQTLQGHAPGADTADRTRRWMSVSWLALVVGCLYTLAAKMSLALLTPDGVAVFWPAAGIAAGTLIALGPPARWAVVIGTMGATILANLLGDRNVISSIVFALCNAGEAVLAAAVIERYFGSPFSLDGLRQVLGLLAAAIFATAISGIGGTLGFVFFHAGTTSALATWQNWFASDALGIITIAPLVIGLAAAAREPPRQGESVEGFIALAALIVLCVITIALPPGPWTTAIPIALLFPILLWIAARCRPVFAAAAAFIVTLAIVWTTTLGVGHFGDPGLPMADRVLAARAGILAVALCAYVLAALFAERRQHEEALAASEGRLQEALTAGAVTTFVWDVGAGASERSANAAQVLGFDHRQTFDPGAFLARVHPSDRERFKALVRGVSRDRPSYNVSFRFKQGDGREIWLEETAKAEFDAMGRLLRLTGLTVDMTARKRSEDERNLRMAALDQRVTNLLTRIAVVAKDTRQGSGSLDEYIEALDRRIQSMADAHALLSHNNWNGADLGELVRRQLAPHATDANAIISGPHVTLTAAATLALAMVLHELATNAAKFGALSTPHGRVEVTWSRGADAGAENLLIEWRELGGPEVAAAPDGRYGAGVIRDLIPQELGGSVELAFEPGGVCCRIELPVEAARDSQPRKLHFASPDPTPLAPD
jgi:two-component sensor histidine kinase/integral membrane sensor domain MASE1